MEPSSVGLSDSHAPVDSPRLPDKPKYEGPERRERYRLKRDVKILVKFHKLRTDEVVGSSKVQSLSYSRTRQVGLKLTPHGSDMSGETSCALFWKEE